MAHSCLHGHSGDVSLTRESLCAVSAEMCSRTDTLRFFSKVSRLKLPQEVTLALQWTSALAGDISGCDNWGMSDSGGGGQGCH